ncbi:MAG: SURF1 family protein [Cellvibrionaceae bacterium]|nr:SURF1 family protein [Cellvibrionaceae bacterium]
MFAALRRHWQIGLLVVIVLPLFIKLGFWQLARAEQKRQLLSVYQQQQNLPPVLLPEGFADKSRESIVLYRKLMARGVFDPTRYWLLDNRTRAGRAGYEVLMPLVTGDNTLLVNRGWVPAPLLREQLPQIVTPEGEVDVQGYGFAPKKNPLLKTSDSDLSQPWPKRVLQVDLQRAATELNAKLYPVLLRLHADSEAALVTQWPLVNSHPEKHQAYALQWFAMAVALCLLYGVLIAKDLNRCSSCSNPASRCLK